MESLQQEVAAALSSQVRGQVCLLHHGWHDVGAWGFAAARAASAAGGPHGRAALHTP